MFSPSVRFNCGVTQAQAPPISTLSTAGLFHSGNFLRGLVRSLAFIITLSQQTDYTRFALFLGKPKKQQFNSLKPPSFQTSQKDNIIIFDHNLLNPSKYYKIK